MWCTASSTRGVFAGGMFRSTRNCSNNIDYVVFSSGGGANDFGDLTM